MNMKAGFPRHRRLEAALLALAPERLVGAGPVDASMPKGNRTISHLVSSVKTGFFSTATRNEKYDPRVRKHVLFVEGRP